MKSNTSSSLNAMKTDAEWSCSSFYWILFDFVGRFKKFFINIGVGSYFLVYL